LEAVPVLVDGTERLDGVETVRLGWSADEPDRPGAARRGLYWIAPGLGHAVIRTQSSRRPGAEMAWKVVEENRSEGFREYHGIWLPSKVHYSAFRYSNDGNTYELAHEIIASFESWIINQTLDAKTFRLEFPAGTLVTDLLNGGRTYIKGAISDPTIHDNLELARTQISNSDDLGEKLEEALAENPFGRATKHLWVICLLLTAFAGGGTGVYFFWMMRRKTRKQE